MQFGWINWINAAAVAYLIAVNGLAARQKTAPSFRSRRRAVNWLEQTGRYGCMVFMIVPAFVEHGEFGFRSVWELLLWGGATALLLAVYGVLWRKRAGGGTGVLYGLVLVPAALFVLNGILLRHPLLLIAALLFGAFHLVVVRENTD